MADNTIKIGGELESMATGKIVAAASAILDKLKNKTQELINQENTSGIQTNAEDIANLNAVVASLQQLIDAATITGGTVANAAEVFVAAIAGLNANNVQAALEALNTRTTFPMIKPNPNTYVSRASEIGYGEGSVDDALQELLGGETTQTISLGDYYDDQYYGSYGSLSSYKTDPKPIAYYPVDVSELLGKELTIKITWSNYTDSSWCNLICFRVDSNVQTSSSSTNGIIKESTAHASAVNNVATLNVEVTNNYLLITTRDRNATFEISYHEVSQGKIDEIEGNIKELEEAIGDAITQEDIDDALSDSSTNPLQNKVINGIIGPFVDKIVITELQLSTKENNYFYTRAGSKTAYPSGAFIYQPIDVSEYLGKTLVLKITWSTYTDTSWCNSMMFRPNNNVEQSSSQTSGRVEESTLHGLATNNVVVYETEVLDNYLLLSARDQTTVMEIAIKDVQKGQISKILDNIPSEPVYVATNGDDDNNGDEGTPFATINKALEVSNNIIVKDGFYIQDTAIDFSKCKQKNISIKAAYGSRVILFGGVKLSEADGTLVSGYTKVYSLNVGTSYNFNRHWIYQYGVEDETTEITARERTAYHKRNSYRCDFTTINKVSSIAEIEEASDFSFYYDNGTLYFSRPEAITSEKFLWLPANAAMFANTKGRTLNLDGLWMYGRGANLKDTLNSVITDCHVCGTCYSGYAWSLDKSKNLLLDRCEACRSDDNGNGGDGFNVHTSTTSSHNVDRTEYCSFELRNCWSHDNRNDGYSDHEDCEGFINGGLFEYNSRSGGAGLTPAYGANDVIKDAITQCNFSRGFQYSGHDVGVTYPESTSVFNVLSRWNTDRGFSAIGTNVQVDLINCVAYGNKDGFNGGDGLMRCINCKSVDNTQNNYANVTNIGSN